MSKPSSLSKVYSEIWRLPKLWLIIPTDDKHKSQHIEAIELEKVREIFEKNWKPAPTKGNKR